MAGHNGPSSADISTLFPKFDDPDSDIRFMTLVDLYKLLTAGGSSSFWAREQSTSTKVIDRIIKLLDDSNGDVQSQALKCIGPLSTKVSSDLLGPFLEKIVSLRTEKSQDASIPATAARTLVLSLPQNVSGAAPTKSSQDASAAISKILIPRLLGQYPVEKDRKEARQANIGPGMLNLESPNGVEIDAIDLLSNALRCFGSALQIEEIQALQQRLTAILEDARTGPIAKKRAVTAMSILSLYMPNALLSSFVSSAIESFHSAHTTPSKRRLLISLMGAVARAIPQRFGPYLKTLAPFVLSAVSQTELEESIEALTEGNLDPTSEEAKEAAFTALDDFLVCCSEDMLSFTDDVVDSCIRYLTYDPAVVLNDDGDDEMNDGYDGDEDEADGEDEDYEQEGGMDDDEDSSWKIRRAATKALYTLISTRGSEVIDNGIVFEKIAPALIKSFKDREESVRLEVLSTMALIIKKTAETIGPLNLTNGENESIHPGQAVNPRKRRRGESNPSFTEEQTASRGFASPARLPSPTSTSGSELLRLGPSMLGAASKLLTQKAVATRQATLHLLRNYLHIRYDCLANYLGKILESATECVKLASAQSGVQGLLSSGTTSTATGTSLRLEALQFVASVFDTHSSKSVAPYVDQVIQALIYASDDKYFKVASEAFATSESVVQAITPPRAFGYDKQSAKFVEKMFDVVLKKAEINELDTEVRQRAIHVLGVCLARTATVPDTLPASKRKKALNFLLARLGNETARTTAIGAVDLLFASSQNQKDLDSTWVQQVALELAQQLRKSNRRLRGSSLLALRRLTKNATACTSLDNATVSSLTASLLPLLNMENAQHLPLTIEVLTNLVGKAPGVVVTGEVNALICKIVVEPLSGYTQRAFLELVEAIGTQGVGAPLMASLLQNVGVNGDLSNVGTAIGTLLVAGGSSLPITKKHILDELRTRPDDQRVALSLFILGEVGLRQGQDSGIESGVFVEHLQSKSELVQRAAAIALGRAGAGNVQVILPVILTAAESKGNTQSLMLSSIKELLQQANRTTMDTTSYSQDIWTRLMKMSSSVNNRAVTAECIGKLAAAEPARYLPLLQNHLSDTDSAARGMVMQAVRFALSDSDESTDEAFKPTLIKMLTVMLKDNDLENRRLAMTTVYSAARNRQALILPNLSSLFPYIIKAAEIDRSLIREVSMGPFRHKTDDGLETRKSAYETLHSLLDMAYVRMNRADLFERVLAGLKDEHDIKMLSILMITKLIVIDPDETARRLDSFAGAFQSITSIKLKDNAVKQEMEKLEEAIKDVLILSVRLRNRFPEATASSTGNLQGQTWKAYLDSLKKEFPAKLQSAESDAKAQPL